MASCWWRAKKGKDRPLPSASPIRSVSRQCKENEVRQEIDYKSLGPRKVLVAEDVELNQFLARHILESWDFEVVIAGNGLEAIEQLGKDAFDCILMDVQMPEMDGIEATHHIRSLSDPVKANIPIIALTANALKGDSEKYLAAGMTDYLAKPFDEERLFRVISRNLTRMQPRPLPPRLARRSLAKASPTTTSSDDSRTDSTQKNNHNNMSSANRTTYTI